jgi:branched-chain amino acid transport system ATP-binding protein
MSALLRLDAVAAGYRDLIAVREVSLEVHVGEAVVLIGGNGAGKTTTLRAITGLLPLRGGRVEFMGERLDGLASAQIAARGIAHVPEGRQLFPTMTVRENLEMGAFTRRDQKAIREDIDRVYDLFPRLKERERQKGGTMSGGEQQMLAIGRALMAQPRVLLLDEPSLGLAPLIVRGIFDIIRDLHAAGVTILLVEQNASLALQIADRAYVLEAGRLTIAGPAAELLTDERVRRAYLG